MALKTFNVSQEVYEKFYRLCKEYGLSMSRQIEMFMASQVAEEPEARKEYVEKLERIRKGKFVSVKSFAGRYGL